MLLVLLVLKYCGLRLGSVKEFDWLKRKCFILFWNFLSFFWEYFLILWLCVIWVVIKFNDFCCISFWYCVKWFDFLKVFKFGVIWFLSWYVLGSFLRLWGKLDEFVNCLILFKLFFCWYFCWWLFYYGVCVFGWLNFVLFNICYVEFMFVKLGVVFVNDEVDFCWGEDINLFFEKFLFLVLFFILGIFFLGWLLLLLVDLCFFGFIVEINLINYMWE